MKNTEAIATISQLARLTIVRVQVAVAGVHRKQRASVRQSMFGQVGEGTVQLLLEQGGALLRGGGGLLVYGPVRGAGRRGLGADGIAPLTVVRRA